MGGFATGTPSSEGDRYAVDPKNIPPIKNFAMSLIGESDGPLQLKTMTGTLNIEVIDIESISTDAWEITATATFCKNGGKPEPRCTIKASYITNDPVLVFSEQYTGSDASVVDGTTDTGS